MNLRFWILLFLLTFSFPLAAQTVLIPDSLSITIDTTTINDISTQTLDIITPNQGFSFNSFWRGTLGMFILIFISYIFSANRKGINWRTVGIGLSIQLLIAIGVLQVPIIQSAFEAVVKVFVSILDYTR
ncbi:MAG: Na+ dependent nucleoside transporter N-terminal domain-containing protein, partial [Eudoraea sp.]|uniref:Na+ dependent nucleoside transporter N-terminal domain-containing protein n=1 Tax=Eudoraea sp. TaxID=1979955 RepID=UPI003C7433BD